MGWRYEVEAYILTSPHHYEWQTTWTGQSLFAAWRAMREAKRNVGAVRLIWR